MKSASENSKVRKLHVRFDDREFDKINQRFISSKMATRSEYLRSILFCTPIKILRRNKSLDELMYEIILLRNELDAIDNNYNQEAKKLYSFKKSMGTGHSDKSDLENIVTISEKISEF